MTNFSIDKNLWKEAIKLGLLKESELLFPRIRSLEKYYQEQFQFFAPWQSRHIPFFGEERRHLTCTQKSIVWSPDFWDPVRELFYITFLGNLCGQEMFFVKNQQNQNWWSFLNRFSPFNRRLKFIETLPSSQDALYLVREEDKNKVNARDIFYQITYPLFVDTDYSFQINSLKELVNPNLKIYDTMPATRNLICFISKNDLPDVAFVYQNVSPLEIFVERVELLPPVYRDFSPHRLFNQVVVREKKYSLEECKHAFLDYMPGRGDYFRNKFFEKNQLEESEIEKIFLKELHKKN